MIYRFGFSPNPYPSPTPVCKLSLFLSLPVCLCVAQRDRKGWPLLTVEAEVNGASKRTNDRGPSSVCSLDKRSCPVLDALVSTVQNIIFLTIHFFTLSVPIAQQPGLAVVLGRLSLCLWCRQSSLLTAGGGGEGDKLHDRQKSLALYKSFNTLWTPES
jgi:hypothetical protein